MRQRTRTIAQSAGPGKREGNHLTKITRVRATPVNVPLEAAYVWSYGALPGFTQTIIEVETDAGLTGIGEAPSAAAAQLINATFAEALAGCDPIDITGCELRCLPSTRGVQSVSELAMTAVWGGVEMALWDLCGKAWNQPVYQLLGGAVRKDIAFTEYFAYRLAGDGKGGEASAEAVAVLRMAAVCRLQQPTATS